MQKKILGMPIAMFIIGILVIGGASAAIVTYLSNTAEMDITVESPMTVEFGEFSHGATTIDAINNAAAYTGWVYTLPALATTGLSTSELGLRLENNADVDINSVFLELDVANSLSNVGCSDISSLTFVDVGCSAGTPCYQVEQQLAGIGLCNNNGDGTITYAIPINLIQSGASYSYPVTVTFANVAPADYVFEATVEE